MQNLIISIHKASSLASIGIAIKAKVYKNCLVVPLFVLCSNVVGSCSALHITINLRVNTLMQLNTSLCCFYFYFYFYSYLNPTDLFIIIRHMFV